MADKNIDIAIRARNEAGAALKQVKADITGLEQASGGVNLGGMLAGGAVGFGLAAVADLALQAGAAIFDLSKQAANVQALEQSFDSLAAGVGTSGDAMLQSMRAAARGQIADADLIMAANRAMLMGVAGNADQMGQLLQVAEVRGRAMGLSVSQAFNDLVTGVARLSPLILDNLGITVNAEAAYQAYAQSVGIAADKLTDAQRKQALLNSIIQSTDVSSAPLANNFERMDAAIANAKVALGELFGPAVAVIAQQLADSVTQVTTVLQDPGAAAATVDLDRQIADLTAQYNKLLETRAQFSNLPFSDGAFFAEGPPAGFTTPDTSGPIDAQVRALQAQIAALQYLRNELTGVQQVTALTRDAAWDAATGWDKFAVSANTASGAAAAHAAAADRVRASLAALAGQADVTGAALQSAWLSAAGALGASQALAGFKDSQKELAALQQEWQYMGLTSEEIEFRKAELVQDTTGDIADQIAAVKEVTKATGGLATAVASVNKEYADLQTKVSGVLAGALDVGVGVKAADLLPREDDINENARRLADIAVNGLTGQDWLGEFQREAPGAWADIMLQVAAGADAKTAAAKILRDFEDGLRPDLIDKDAAKERVKRMILGEQSASALAEEIAAELAAEMGIPLQQALAAAGGALGVTTGAAGEAATGAAAGAVDMSSSGAGAGQTFFAGFMANADGAALVAGIVARMKTDLPQFKDTGATAGTLFGGGFMGTVESSLAQPLIQLLATLVTPAVRANLAATDSQTTPP